MKQKDNNNFIIKSDGTIVRIETPPKISEMKKKLTSNTNRSFLPSKKSSSKMADILIFMGFIFTLGCVVFGAIRQYDYTDGNILATIVTAILCGAIGWICVSVVFFVFSYFVSLFKKS